MPDLDTAGRGWPVAGAVRHARAGAALIFVALPIIALATGCAARPGASASAAAGMADAAKAQPDYAGQLVDLVESFQPLDPRLPNRWSEVVRTGFLYSGALIAFAAASEPVQAYVRADPEHRRAEDFMLAPLGELSAAGADVAALSGEARRFLDMLDSQELLSHLDQIAAPCRLEAPPPYRHGVLPLVMQETYEQGAIRNLATACGVRMRFAAEARQGERLIAAFASGMQLGRALCGRPMLVALTNAQSVQDRVMLRAIGCVRTGTVDAQNCRVLLVAAERFRLPHPAVFLEIERIIGHDAIDRYYRQRAREQARQTEGTTSIDELSRDEVRHAFDQAMDRASHILRQQIGDEPMPADPPATAGVTFSTLETPAGRTDPDGLLASLMPPLGPLITEELEHRCTRAALITALLLELHRLEHGAYPETLAELGTTPPDPLGGGGPLGYIPPTPPASGGAARGYTLYSVGSDRTDNGANAPGSSRPRRDALQVPPRWPGTDFVITNAADD